MRMEVSWPVNFRNGISAYGEVSSKRSAEEFALGLRAEKSGPQRVLYHPQAKPQAREGDPLTRGAMDSLPLRGATIREVTRAKF